MKQHIIKTAATCFYHIRHLHQVHHQVCQAITQQLVLAFIMSRLDYCSSLLAGLPMPLECRCTTGFWLKSLRPHHTEPHPSKFQTVLHHPCHLLWLQPDISDGSSTVSQHKLITFWALVIFHLTDGLRLHTKFGEHAFSHAGSTTWNVLPDNIHTVDNPVKFQNKKPS